MYVSWEDFEKIDLRIGTIIEVLEFPEARKPAYKLKIDFGKEIGVKKSSAQITDLYTKQQLLNKQVLAVVNFAPKQIGSFMSEVLVTGFKRKDGSVILASSDRQIQNGMKLL